MSRKKPSLARFGEMIDQLLHALTASKTRWGMGHAIDHLATYTGYAASTVYRWKEGSLRPSDDILEKIAAVAKADAKLPRSWGEELFSVTRLPDAEDVTNRIWGMKNLRVVVNNLPSPSHTTFIGRQAEIKRLTELLSPNHSAPLISIDGIGGVGKTALVLEVAYRCLRASTGELAYPGIPIFDAIIFVSAKSEILTPDGIITKSQTQRTMRNIFGVIAKTLDKEEITHVPAEEQLDLVTDSLGKQKTLLIVDNLETMEDKQGVVQFLYDLPANVKVIITTRERVFYSPIRLEHLQEVDGEHLIKHEAADKGILVETNDIQELYKKTGGVPAAIIYAIGQLAYGYSIATVLNRLGHKTGNVARFCFEGSVARLRGGPAHRLLMAMAMFPVSPLRQALVFVSGLDSDNFSVDDGLVQLLQLSLIRQDDKRYNMLPLTREFAFSELCRDKEFERAARDRWVKWYLDYTKEHGGSDKPEWHVQYDYIEEEWENLRAVLDWCDSQDRYEDIKAFWQDDRVDDCANLYGFWDDRLQWKDWLVGAAERRGDWETVVSSRSSKGCTLALIAQPSRLSEANIVLEQAWKLHNQASAETLSYLANHIAMLRILEGNFLQAHQWLDTQEDILDEALLDKNRKIRAHVNLLYYRGVALFHEAKLIEAKNSFNRMIDEAESISWQRGTVNAKNWLADIALCEEDLETAERYLETGLPIVNRNKDRRRVAYYKRSFASLEYKKGNRSEALRWCGEAIMDFDRLGMQPESKQMNLFAQKLKEKATS